MVNELDLYRTYTITKGTNAGDYPLYFNRKVALHYLPENVIIYKWGQPECLEAVAGDYIEALDGAVVVLMNVRPYKSKTTNIPFWFFRFPMCMIRVYRLKSGQYKFGDFYAQMTYLNKNRITAAVKYGTDNQKVRFATLIIAGLHPFKAYRIAFGQFQAAIDIRTLHKRINKLMEDKVVQQELLNQIIPLSEKLGEKFTDKKLVDELDLLLANSRKGSDAHRENIKFIMALLNKLPAAMYPGNKASKSLAQDTTYEVIAPPTLGPKKEESL